MRLQDYYIPLFYLMNIEDEVEYIFDEYRKFREVGAVSSQ